MNQENSKVVVITGASGGVGRACVEVFAKAGYRVGLLARGEAGLEAAKRDAEQLGSQASIHICDVADPQQIEQAADEVERILGPIDVWVNNAMATVFAPLGKVEPDEFRRVTEVTYLGTVFGTMTALKRMTAHGQGSIVQVGSALAYRGIPLQSAYCGAKHAIQGFTESLRCELIHDNSPIEITMVQMPALNTPQFDWSRSKMPRKAQPVPPIYAPSVAAEAVLYAATHSRREMDVGTVTAIVTLGNKIAPGFGDHYLAEGGYDSQMRDTPEDPNRPDNLFEPVDSNQDYGAEGSFTDKATDSSLQLWLETSKAAQAISSIANWVEKKFASVVK